MRLKTYVLLWVPLLTQIKATGNVCIGEFCPPTPLRRTPPDLDYTEPLGVDQKSGCLCRMHIKFSICFGRNGGCKSVPKTLKITTPSLVLKATSIEVLLGGDFGHLKQLIDLSIEGNHLLSQINANAFNNLTNVVNLSIYHNPKLAKLHPQTFKGLENLQALTLIKNGFNKLLDITPSLGKIWLPKLQVLKLDENYFETVGSTDFTPMLNSTLSELNMILCGIEYIHPKALDPLMNLKALRIGENSVNASTLTKLMSHLSEVGIELNVLNLYSSGFRKRPPLQLMQAIANSTVKTLYLTRNQFDVINAESFPKMPNLEKLALDDCLIQNLSADAFNEFPSLKTLLLSKNRLASLPNDLNLGNLTYLNLQENSDSFKPYTDWSFSVRQEQFTRMPKLELLNLGYTKILSVYKKSFEGLTSLRILGLKSSSVFYIEPGSFESLPNLMFLNLESNMFARNSDYNSTTKYFEVDLFKGLKSLEVLLLGENSIKTLKTKGGDNPFRHLKALKHLSLEHNQLVTISQDDFACLEKLESLDVSHNFISTWQVRLFAQNPNLVNLYLDNNKIGYLSQAVVQDLNQIERLELGNNPMSCGCRALQEFNAYVHGLNRTHILEVLGQTDVYCVFPEQVINLTLDFVLKGDNSTLVCRQITLRRIVFILPCIVLLVIILASVILGFFYRWHIKYWLFLARLYLSRKGRLRRPKKASKDEQDFLYDVFVSYSNDDQNFVVRLVNMLENYSPFLKLCVYERDFQIGTMITENVLDNIAKSRKTLLVVSDSYAKSNWCIWESQIAEHHRLFLKNDDNDYVNDSLVIIKLGPVNKSNLTPTLKYLIKTRIYLQWNESDDKQKIFWDKLRTALAPPVKECSPADEVTHI